MCLQLVSGDATADDHEALVAAWNRRQNSIHTLHFTWTGTHFRAAGAAEDPFLRQSEAKPMPRADVSHKTQTSLYVDKQGRFRLDSEGEVWSSEDWAYVPQTITDVLEGEFARSFHSHSGFARFPGGFIGDRKASPMARVLRCVPIMIVFRPFDRAMSHFDPANLRLTTERGMVDGRSCIVFRQRNGDYVRSVWVDNARDFVPVRYVSGPRGRTSIQIDISYSNDPRYGWIPTSWNIALMDAHGGIEESWDTRSVKYELNEIIPDSAFQLAFPPGTMVRDSIAKGNYLVLENGEKRPVLPGEYTGKNYEELLHSKPGQLTTNRPIAVFVACVT